MLALSLETMCTLEEHFINKGILLGREEGREEGIIQVAKNLLSQGSTVEFVRNCTGLTLSKLQELAASLKQAVAAKHASAVA